MLDEDSNQEEIEREVKLMCICHECPTFQECNLMSNGEEKGFCLMGKSNGIYEAKECICNKCPVYRDVNLKGQHYCFKDQDEEETEAELFGFECENCEFTIQSEDEDEIILIVKKHLMEKHGLNITVDEIKNQLFELSE